MSHVQIEPGGLFAYRWDADRRKYLRSRVRRATVLARLRDTCRIKDGTTLRDIFRVVHSYRLLKVFVAQYSWCWAIDEFHAQAEEPARKLDDPEPIDYLEVYRTVDVRDYSTKAKPRKKSYEHGVDFHGIGRVGDPVAFKARNGYEPPKDGVISYSVSYSPMNELADLPVRLNEDVEIGQRSRMGARVPDISATAGFSLLEVLDAIYWDVSFVGSPSANAEFLAEMKGTMEKIKSGEIETFPMDLGGLVD